MVATTARSATRAVVVLIDLPPNSRTPTIPSEAPSLSAANLAETSMTRGFGTSDSRRLPRVAYFARQRQSSTRPAGFPRGFVSQRRHSRWTDRLRTRLIGDANSVDCCSPRALRRSRTRGGLSRVQRLRAACLARLIGNQ